MDQRRLSAIILLKRLKKYEMEKEARALGELRREIAELNQQRQDLVDSLQFQAQSFDTDFTPYMQQFIPAAKAEILLLANQMIQLEPRITALEERVSEKFSEYKTFDTVHKNLNAEIRREQDSRETTEIEETVLWRWMQTQRMNSKKDARRQSYI